MSNEVTKLNTQMAEYTPDQMRLITEVIAKNATQDELELFLYRCKNLGLDPLKTGQIYFIKYNQNSPGTIVVGIDGFRAKASRSGKLSGISRGAIKDDKGKCVGAWAEVHRTDWERPAREEVSLAEYSTGKAMWAKMPETMIKKVAEAAALRMAFPDDLGGIYTNEEMDQAEASNDRHAERAPQAEAPRLAAPTHKSEPSVKPRSERDAIIEKVLAASKALSQTDQELTKWVRDEFQKARNELTDEDMKTLLEQLQYELSQRDRS